MSGAFFLLVAFKKLLFSYEIVHGFCDRTGVDALTNVPWTQLSRRQQRTEEEKKPWRRGVGGGAPKIKHNAPCK